MGYKLRYPIVIHGGTGGGKTFMMSFIVNCLLGDHFKCYTIDAGTSNEEFLETMVNYVKEAEVKSEEEDTNNLGEKKNYWIVIDESNTCLSQCSIAELINNRFSSQHEMLSSMPSNILFAVLQNPYRIDTTSINLSSIDSSKPDSSKIFENKVNPSNNSLLMSYLIDYSEKNDQMGDENMLIENEVRSKLQHENCDFSQNSINLVIKTIKKCQLTVRECIGK